MKRELSLLLMVFSLSLVYVFFHSFQDEALTRKNKMTMDDSFASLMGIANGKHPYIQTDKDWEDLSFYQKLYEKNRGYQFMVSPIMRIPNQVHLIWLGPRPFPIKSIKHIRSWIACHPDWTFHFWTDRKRPAPCNGMEVHDVREFSFLFLKKYYDLSDNWGEKSDLLRYEILYQRGGVYIDHDASCNRSFFPLHSNYDFYACVEKPHGGVAGFALTAGIGIIGAKAHHPILKGAIDAVIHRWEEVSRTFADPNPLVQAQRVVHRTYIALTLSLEDNVEKESNRDIVLPAYYFYPEKDSQGFYSHHDYSTSWHDMAMSTDQELFLKDLKALRKRDTKILSVEWMSAIALLGCFILHILINRKILCKDR